MQKKSVENTFEQELPLVEGKELIRLKIELEINCEIMKVMSFSSP